MTETNKCVKIAGCILTIVLMLSVLPMRIFAAGTEASYQATENGEWLNATLSEALENVYENGTVKLMKDMTKSEDYTLDDVTLDMNGYNFSFNGSYSFNVYGETDIINSGDEASEIKGDRYYVIVTHTDSTCTVNNVSLSSNERVVSIGLNASFEIKGADAVIKDVEEVKFLCKGHLKIGQEVTLIHGDDELLFGIYESNTRIDLSERTDLDGVKFHASSFNTELILPEGYLIKLDDGTLTTADFLKTSSATIEITIVKCNHDSFTYTADDNIMTESCICGIHSETATIAPPSDLVYDGKEKTVTVTYSDNWQGGELEIEYRDDEMVNAGEIVAEARKDMAIASVAYEIEKADSVLIEAPEVKTGLVYDGTRHELGTAGSADGGTIHYSFGGSGMEPEIPVASGAGEYKVLCMIKGDENHNDTIITTQYMIIKIEQAIPTVLDTPSAARIKKGSKLSESVISGDYAGIDGTELAGTFTWLEPDKEMLEDGKEAAVFTPGDNNYKVVELELDVDVYTVSSGGGGGGGSTVRYTVKFDTNGGNETADETVFRNSKLKEPVQPVKSGYTFMGWFKDAELTQVYDFNSLVTESFTLYAKWEKRDDESGAAPRWKNPFKDVNENDWYYTDVRYAVQNGLFNGITDVDFAPEADITRAMMVTVLYRAEGEPKVEGKATFKDVNDDAYYADAVVWGQQNGIINGYSEAEFAPDRSITREQIAAIMLRYAQYKGVAPTGAWAIRLDYADLAEIADYATEGVMYCKLKGIMQGKNENRFAPHDFATRAEIAAILRRFTENN